jgi:hypothetical protein
MNGNSFVSFMLHTPLRGVLGDTLLITVTGRKSGRQYSTPVNFFEKDGCLWVLSSRERTWWRNLRGGAPVKLFLRGQEACARGELLLDEALVAAKLGDYLHAIPMAARSMNILVEQGCPNPADLARAAKARLFICLRLDPR